MEAAGDGRETRIQHDLMASEERRPAPGFALKNLDGETVELKDYRGKVLVLDFWATWCAPCLLELIELNAAYRQYQDDPLVAFAAVSVDADKTRVAPHAVKHGYDFPILLTDGVVERNYGTQMIPQLYVIGPEGNIRFHLSGYRDDGFFRKKLDWMIEAVKDDEAAVRDDTRPDGA